MTASITFGAGAVWIVAFGLLALALCRAASAGDRHLDRARKQLASSQTPDAVDSATASQIYLWAVEDGHRTPGIDERRARHDVRPRGGLCEIVPIDELRRRRDRRIGGAA